MIVCAILAEVSIGKMFIAGILPGILLSGIYSTYIIYRGIRNPEIAPRMQDTYSWTERIRALKDLAPTLILILMVLGCLLDGFSIVVMTLPIALPMVTAAGFGPIWFGIYLDSDNRIILPVGSTEQHGAFAPLGTDTYVAAAIAEGAAQETGSWWLRPCGSAGAPITGHPCQATPEKGKAYHDHLVDRLVQVLEMLKVKS